MRQGEIARVVAWVCEGVENPWGFSTALVEGLLSEGATISGSEFRTRARRKRIPLEAGDVALILRHVDVGHPTIDPFYVALVRGQRICVLARFLEPE